MTGKQGRNPVQKRGRDARGRLLDAAVKGFSSKGYEGASLREIAHAADENVAMIKYYFGDKDRLWRASMDLFVAGQISRIATTMQAMQNATPAERLSEMIREFVRMSAEHPERVRMMVSNEHVGTDRMRWFTENHLVLPYRMFEAAFSQAVAAGYAPTYPIEQLYYAFFGAASLMFAADAEFEILTGSKEMGTSELVERHADMMIDLFLPGLGTATSTSA